MAKCDGCSGDTDHIKYNKEDRKWYCLDCRAEAIYEHQMRIEVFEPYELKHGPIDMIPNSDPNKKLHYEKDGKRVADMDTLHIENREAEKKYFELMDIRKLDKGEKVLGIKAELKDKPARRTFSFVGNSACSSCS